MSLGPIICLYRRGKSVHLIEVTHAIVVQLCCTRSTYGVSLTNIIVRSKNIPAYPVPFSGMSAKYTSTGHAEIFKESYASVIDPHLMCSCMSSGRPCLVSLLFIPSIFPNSLY